MISREQDKFYTNADAAKSFIDMIKSHFNLDEFDNIIEPSAGSGALLKYLPKNTIGVDLYPEASNIIKHDFLTWEFPSGKTIIIGNPPFGRNSKLAIKFFNRAARHGAEVICFIVPATWEKHSIQRQLAYNFGLISSKRMPNSSFLLDGKPVQVRCVMQIWTRGIAGKRHMTRRSGSNPYFAFVKREQASFAIRQAYPKYVPMHQVDDQSHYFIRPKVAGVEAVFAGIDWQSSKNLDLIGGASVSCLDRDAVLRFYTRYAGIADVPESKSQELSFLGI